MTADLSTPDWVEQAAIRLESHTPGGYQVAGPLATEPTAVAALALRLWGKQEAAERGCVWLLDNQAEDGSLGVDARNPTPCWATPWAVLALLPGQREPSPQSAAAAGTGAEATATKAAGGDGPLGERRRLGAEKAVQWLLRPQVRARKTAKAEGGVVGHDTTLEGWPWVETTSPWVEPTALAVLALRRAGMAQEPRVREAVRLLLDRQLADGGWNHGNTTVFGAALRPLVQPTGLALWALGGEAGLAPRVQLSLDYLGRSLDSRTGVASLCYALLGLSAHKAAPPTAAEKWLQAAATRTLAGDGSPYKLALLLLAAKREELFT